MNCTLIDIKRRNTSVSSCSLYSQSNKGNMDVAEEEISIKHCYKCEHSVLDNVNITYNWANSMIVLWNKYQIIIYEDVNFISPENALFPEFHINLVIPSENLILCLDSNDNIHVTSLKFKTSQATHKRLKTSFQAREKGIKTCIRYKETHILSLKYEAGTYFLCLNRISLEFKLEKKIILLRDTEHWPLGQDSQQNHLLTSRTVNKDHYEDLKKIFTTEKSCFNLHDLSLVVLSPDRFGVYSCLFSPTKTEDATTLVKLYDCPAKICNVEIVDSGELYLLIGLTIGSLIRISLNDLSRTPDVVHLNTALYKMMVFNDFIIYTDGNTMWKSEESFSHNIVLTQFIVTNVKDIIKCGDLILCTTFTKQVYKLAIDDKTVYRIPVTVDEYCSADKVLNNDMYLTEIFKAIEQNKELCEKLYIEEDYITALSMKNRQDLVSKAIESSVLVIETYNEASNLNCALTEDLKKYFEDGSWLFLVKIVNKNIFEALNDILSHLADSIRIHIIFSSGHRTLKTTSINLGEPLKIVNFLIPLSLKPVPTELKVNIKIILKIPGVFDKKQQIYTVLYKKDIDLTSENFIKTRNITVSTLNKPKDSLEALIHKMTLIQHGSLVKLTDISKLKESENIQWSYYVKLPNNYEELFKTDSNCKKYLSSAKSTALTLKWSTKEFLKSETDVTIIIGNDRVIIKIENDGLSNPVLKITGSNPKTALNLRNFFSKILYNEYENCERGKDFISSHLYTTIENVQKRLHSCITNSASIKEFLQVNNLFEKNVIGNLPL